jgi:outer membrane protein OmpA-like peptidoglycan-associated protein
LNVQGGASYHIGEASFSNLISPHAQMAVGYQFDPLWGARLSVNGWEGRNRYAYPSAKYKWNYLQPSLEAMLNVTNLFAGWDYERPYNVYAFAGLGLGWEFNNDDAVKADKWMRDDYNNRMKSVHVERQVTEFQKLWKDNRLNPVVRAGIGADYQIAENIAIGAEVNANLLPDHWNSKKGKNDNRDWQFNALIGAKITLGKSHGRTEPVYDVLPQPVEYDMPIDKISFNVNIYFIINTSYIRDSQVPKLTALIAYLREHPKSFVRLSGFADKETGNPQINMRLSIERSQNVSRYLQDAGISEARIRRFAKGDTVQPFDIPEDNRVCICFVYDPDNPDPQAFEY